MKDRLRYIKDRTRKFFHLNTSILGALFVAHIYFIGGKHLSPARFIKLLCVFFVIFHDYDVSFFRWKSEKTRTSRKCLWRGRGHSFRSLLLWRPKIAKDHFWWEHISRLLQLWHCFFFRLWSSIIYRCVFVLNCK